MKIMKAALFCALIPCFMAWGGQEYYEARADGMGGAGVAASNRQGAAFINPALLALEANKSDGYSLLLPVVGVDGADRDNMLDNFDRLQDSYDALDRAISAADTGNIARLKGEVIADLQSLQDNSADLSAGIGFSLALPGKKLPIAVFYKTYLDAMGLADIEQSDIDDIGALDPVAPPPLMDLNSSGIVAAGATSDIGVALSFPLSIVNMPVTVGISPKVQRIDSYFYAVSANNFEASDFNDDKYRNDETSFNVDVGVAMAPMEGLVIGLSGRNLVNHEVESIEIDGLSVGYRVEPLVTAGIAYDWSNFSVTTDIDLTERNPFSGMEGTQYWRLGGEMRTGDWLSLRLGYRHDLKDNRANVYSLGSGFAIGRAFRFDLTGIFGNDDAIGGVLQTSYHF